MLVLIGLADAARAQSRVALVIGNSAYRNATVLANPANDAADVSQSLRRLGFEVTTVSDAGFDGFRRALIDFGRLARNADMAILFFGGHGIEIAGENWLLPVDADLKSDSDVSTEAINLRAAMQAVSNAKRLGLVILDACRNNPFAGKARRPGTTRSIAAGLAPVDPGDNMLVAYAARDGTVAADGTGRNSPYTSALLRHLETPGLELEFLFRSVRDDVMAATNDEQQPFVYGALSGTAVYLKETAPRIASAPATTPSLPPAPAPAPAPPLTPAPAATNHAADIMWASIRTSSDPQVFENFLSRFPGSAREADARNRVAELRLVGACDRLAALDTGRDRTRSATSQDSDTRTPGPAINACEQGLERFPDNARFAYQSGWIAENRKDFSTAREHYGRAAAAGNATALFRLGILYESGPDGTPDFARASEFYGKAATAGHQRAMTNLARLYETGRGVAQDYGQARRWYEIAASLGDRPAMASIGKLYERGLGVAKDEATARAWFRRAEGVVEPAQAKGR